MLSAFLSMAGCQFTPTAEPVAEADAADKATVMAGDAPVIRSPNPYLSNQPSLPSIVKARFQSANEALAAGQWAQAEQDLQWLTAHYFELSGPWVNLALLYQQTGQLEKIEPAFKQAISANGQNIYAYNQYGIFLREQGRFSQAEVIYRQALAVWPDYADAHLNLAILYDLYMGKLEPALEHYQAYQSLQDEPDRKINGWIIDTQRRINAAGIEG